MAISKIESARFTFLYKYPFFASLFFNLKVKEVDKEFFGYDSFNPETGEVVRKYRTEYGAVSSRTLYVVTENVEKLNKDQVIRFFAHETMHLFLDHIRRGKGRSHRKYNAAADIALEFILEEENVGEHIPNTYGDAIVKQRKGEYVPQPGMIDFLKFQGMTTEEIYDLLPEGDDYPDDLVFSDNEPEFSDAELKGMVAKANNLAKMCGKGYGAGLGKIIDEMMDPKLPWNVLLRRFFKARMKKKMDWKTPNKQFLSQSMYFGSKVKDEGLDEIVVIEDDSGSISDAERVAYNTELMAIFKMVEPKKIHKIHWDTDLIEEMTLNNLADAKRNAKEVHGGGTDMCAAVVYARQRYPKAKACIVLTDGYTNWYKVPRPDDVLWVITTNVEAECGGKTIHMKL